MPRINGPILGLGHFLPEGRTTNQELEKGLGLEPGWIAKRTGIEARRVVDAGQGVSDLAVQAGQRAMESSVLNADQFKGLVLATSTPDHLLPPTAPRVATELGMQSACAFDMAVACSGFVYALVVARGLASTLQGPILVIAANVLSSRVNPNDPATVALFADGAGAVIVGGNDGGGTARAGALAKMLSCHLEADGSKWDAIMIPAGGSKEPFSQQALDDNRARMQINDGRGVFRFAVEAMTRSAQISLAAANLKTEDIRWWIPHQASDRVIGEFCRRNRLTADRVVNVVRDLGNSSAATIPIALSLCAEEGYFESGDKLLLTAAGSGLAAGAVILEWDS